GKLREVDPVDVVGRHADGARIAGPPGRGVVAGARIQHAAADPLLDRGEVVQPRYADGEIDAVERAFQAGIDCRRRGSRGPGLLLPGLVEVLRVRTVVA